MDLLTKEVQRLIFNLSYETMQRTIKVLESKYVQNAINFVKLLMSNYDSSHDFHHVIRVMDLATLIYIKDYVDDKTVDFNVILLSSLFHDSTDFKYDFSKGTDLKSIAIEKLKEFFAVNQIPEEIYEKVIFIIDNISFRKEIEGKKIEMSKELMVVRDADRLDAIGAIGIARCFGYSAVKRQPFFIDSVPVIQNMTAEKYNQQTIGNTTTSYNHFYEKLLTLKDRMLTHTGKHLASERHEFMLMFLRQFKSEMSHVNS